MSIFLHCHNRIIYNQPTQPSSIDELCSLDETMQAPGRWWRRRSIHAEIISYAVYSYSSQSKTLSVPVQKTAQTNLTECVINYLQS